MHGFNPSCHAGTYFLLLVQDQGQRISLGHIMSLHQTAVRRCKSKGTVCYYGPTNTCIVTTAIGDMYIESCPHGLHAVGQEGKVNDDNFSPDTRREVKIIEKSYPDSGYTYDDALKCVDWLKIYFSDPHAAQLLSLPHICVASETGSFRERVWTVLAKNIRPGQTISYAELANMAKAPGANQAVGSAMSNNPIQLIVPCHRVIKSDGTLGSYHKGCRNTVKQWLLKHEGVEDIR